MAESGMRRAVVLVAALCVVGVTVSLGRWQLGRAQAKLDLQAGVQAQLAREPVELSGLGRDAAAGPGERHRPVHATGRWLHAHTLFLDNRQMHGRPGFYVLTPLLLEPDGAGAVLVQRGWVPRDPLERTRLPALPASDAPVQVSARIAPPPARLYAFEGPDTGRIRQNVDLDDLSRETGLALWPVSLLQLQPERPAPLDDPLQRAWPEPAVDVHKHYGYAAQWFGLAALTAVLYVWFQLVRPRRRAVIHGG